MTHDEEIRNKTLRELADIDTKEAKYLWGLAKNRGKMMLWELSMKNIKEMHALEEHAKGLLAMQTGLEEEVKA